MYVICIILLWTMCCPIAPISLQDAIFSFHHSLHAFEAIFAPMYCIEDFSAKLFGTLTEVFIFVYPQFRDVTTRG